MTPESIQTELTEVWERLFAEVTRPCIYDKDFSTSLREYEAKAEGDADLHLQPWLGIMQDSIQWIANLWAVITRQFEGGDQSSRTRAVWALLGAAIVHAVAVRRLVSSGLDTPARAAARAMDEHLCACIAVLHDASLAEGFQASQDVMKAKKFWHAHLNSKAVKQCLTDVEKEIGVGADVSVGLREWRDQEVTAFSQAIHPSYITAVLSAKTIDAKNPEVHAISIFGHASAGSERTLDFACKSVWYFSRMGFFILFNPYRGQMPMINLDANDEMQQMVVVGRSVLSEINKKYWSHKIYDLVEED